MKLSDFILEQFVKLGVDTVFGVPGDYNLRFLDYVEDQPQINWVGNCNELNAAYAADGYARINGLGVLVTTYGVGELSAMNGIAGSFAENVPVIHLVGMPATSAQQTGLAVHHSLASGHFNEFSDMWRNITCATAQLSRDNWLMEIERVISTAITCSKPAYIAIPADLFDMHIDGNIDLQFSRDCIGHEDKIPEICDLIFNTLEQSKRPVAWLGCNTRQFNAAESSNQWVEALEIPFAQTLMAKSLYNEASKFYLGLYAGSMGSPKVQQQFDNADCLVQIGVRITDFNSGGFTHKKFKNNIEITDKLVRINEHNYIGINAHKLILSLLGHDKTCKLSFSNLSYQEDNTRPIPTTDSPWSMAAFWDYMVSRFLPGDILLADAGTSFFCLWERKVAIKHRLLTQVLWSSIGYTLPAALGAACAAKNRRTLVFIGDGALQMTVQELSTIARLNLPVIIFLINNDGYTAERCIHGADRAYNDIAGWRYRQLASAFSPNIHTAKVNDMTSLLQALSQAETGNKDGKVHFIELKFARYDIPQMLEQAVKGLKNQNS
ncbi:MAG: alpha-keto acid decarboxylase family protein [Desulfobacteraceae bacterium]|nr:alpha-keto acid decarboxylase family protein [Desulfobacteraceae bacterium]